MPKIIVTETFTRQFALEVDELICENVPLMVEAHYAAGRAERAEPASSRTTVRDEAGDEVAAWS
jgi:hypothetical protein